MSSSESNQSSLGGFSSLIKGYLRSLSVYQALCWGTRGHFAWEADLPTGERRMWVPLTDPFVAFFQWSLVHRVMLYFNKLFKILR